jgi:endonuclease YncB( thermonuclease family)
VIAYALVACGPIDGMATPDRPMSASGTKEEATVTRVVDGDTIHVRLDGKDVTIRLIGVDTRRRWRRVSRWSATDPRRARTRRVGWPATT